MRKINIGSENFTKVFATDKPGQGNACHEYIVVCNDTDSDDPIQVATISFQNGPIKEFGVNGCHQEDLLAIVLDRLQSFQDGDFKCRENEIAIIKLEEAMHWLNHRTDKRIRRGVEGKNII